MTHRLPTTVAPSRYDIRLEPDLDAATFAGHESVTVTVREPVEEIVLNAVELAVLSVAIAPVDGGGAIEGTASLDPATDRVHLVFPTTITPGEWRLQLGFTGILNDQLHGFYRSTYKDAAGGTHVIAATQFEAVDARRAFPCWDEPSWKATFRVTLVVPEGCAAISNSAVLREEPAGPGRRAVHFAETMKMSTYLVAFVVGPLEATEPVLVGKTPLRVWCVPGKLPLATFAREAGAFFLHFFERYYGIPYPGDKLDLLAIPDFASGAMENLGAITFRETLLLVDEEQASHGELERVADVIAHEIAHMWFGDLATMAWWNGIWLNEAFATFMEMLAVDAWKPEWDRWTSFGVSRAAAMGVDGLRASRPIEFEVKAPKDCEAMFDLLTYEKGASVLRMLEQYLGPETFQAGVRLYLERHAYQNAETGDLWKALGDAARPASAPASAAPAGTPPARTPQPPPPPLTPLAPLPEVMDGWVFQAGYPLVSVEGEGAEVRLRQERFFLLDQTPPATPPTTPKIGSGAAPPGDAVVGPAATWRVPVTVRTSVGGRVIEEKCLLGAGGHQLTLPGTPDWLVANAGGHGFYRVAYVPAFRDRLTGSLDALQPIERFNLLADQFALTLAGRLPAADFLDVTARFRDERDRNVWAVLLGAFGYLNRVVDDAARPGLAALVRDRLRPAVARLGFTAAPGETELHRQLRGDLLRAVGVLGDDAEVQARARELYAAYRSDEEALDPNVAAAVVGILARAGGEAEYAEFVERFERARSPQEEQRYLYALAGFRQAELLEKTLERTLNGDIRSQDAPYVVRALLGSVYGRRLAWEFVKAHWETMARQYPPSAYRRMYEGVTTLVSPRWEAEVRAFFPAHGIELGGRTLGQYLEQLRVAVRFQEREARSLRAYLGTPPG